jgi:predicted nuclease of restriction endonuclease-like (RecB) superfamily
MYLDEQKQFSDIVLLIKDSQDNAVRIVNAELINLYWNVGQYISRHLANSSWGDKTVDELASFIQKEHPELKGFNRRGLYRMKQFYEIYSSMTFASSAMTQIQSTESQCDKIVSSPMTQFKVDDIRRSILAKVSWTHHLVLISRTKTDEERDFYLNLSIREKYSVRELDRQIDSGFFERVMLGNAKLPTKIKDAYPSIMEDNIKDTYVLEFLGLPELHGEGELQKGLIAQMKSFILELGKNFLFIGEEYRVQVGNSDFYIDLLFYHRGLQCLIAFELKAEKFKPEHLGQLDFTSKKVA